MSAEKLFACWALGILHFLIWKWRLSTIIQSTLVAKRSDMIACDPCTHQTSSLVDPYVTCWVHANAAESVEREEGSRFLWNVSTDPPDYNSEYYTQYIGHVGSDGNAFDLYVGSTMYECKESPSEHQLHWGFLSSSMKMKEPYLQIGYGSLLPHAFWFVIQ
jgi:hypothetical protein